MASSDCSTFAIVCDNPCGLEASQLEALGVSVIPGALTFDGDQVGEFYRNVLESGVQKILSIHVSADFSDSLLTAKKACENNPDIAEAIFLVDSGNMPAAMGIMLERLSVARNLGATFEAVCAYAQELAEVVATMYIAMNRVTQHKSKDKRPRLSLRHQLERLHRHISNDMYLYRLVNGRCTEVARSSDFTDLAGRISRLMSDCFVKHGEIRYVVISSGDKRTEKLLKKPLYTNEYDAECIAERLASPDFRKHLGEGSVGVACIPKALYQKAGVLMNDTVDILLLGAGGREHALLTKLQESPRAGKIYVAPGNGGMAAQAEIAPIDQNNPEEIVAFAQEKRIGLVVIGPEAPLVVGVADAVRQAGIACFGPNENAAQMEGSKAFAKGVMERANVPTAAWKSFTDQESCEAYVRQIGAPVVVKADGLAAGKGVIVATELEQALEGVRECFSGHFGDAGATVVVEEFLEGPECSLLALTDGTYVVPLATAQDHKRAYDEDKGPNTGGMGVYSPVPFVTDEELSQMIDIEQRVVDQLKKEGINYSGCLYGGFMLTKNGPKVLEFNARFGDPETQVVLPRLEGDLVSILMACDNGTLRHQQVAWSDTVAVSVVLASAGYPGSYEKGKEITGIEDAQQLEGVSVYHAGTAQTEDGKIVTAGGRVLNVTALAPTFEEARARAYEACDLINFEGKQLRHDIGLKALQGRPEK